jgi:hypothetical protein
MFPETREIQAPVASVLLGTSIGLAGSSRRLLVFPGMREIQASVASTLLDTSTLNAILRLCLYMWSAKTMSVAPNATNFVRAHTVHHQPLIFEHLNCENIVREVREY